MCISLKELYCWHGWAVRWVHAASALPALGDALQAISFHAYRAQYMLLHTAVLGINFCNLWVKVEVTGDVTKELYILTRHALSFKKAKVGKKWFNEIRNSWIIWHFVTVLIVFLLLNKVSSQTLCSFTWRDVSHFAENRGHILSLYIL